MITVATVAALGFVATVAGLLIKAGKLRWWLSTYWDTSLPAPQRAGGLVLLPAGVIMLVGVAGAILEGAGVTPFGLVLMFTALVVFILVMPIVWSRPPAWLKPEWLRVLEVQTARDPDLRARLAAQQGRAFSETQYRSAWILLVALAGASLVFAWPPAVLIGLAVAGATLYARRPTATSQPGASVGSNDSVRSSRSSR